MRLACSLMLVFAGCLSTVGPGGGAGAGDNGGNGAAGSDLSLSPSPADGGVPTGGDTPPNHADGGASGGGLTPGTLAVTWMHGQASCNQTGDPELQVHAYNATTYIIRQDKCRTFEAPFVYLLLGTTSALLLDTGATNTSAIHDRVMQLIGARPLLVAHSHAHGDHVASDAQFAGQPNTTLIAKTVPAVQAAFGIKTWPTDPGTVDLGDRILDVVPIPGHEATHIAIYDRQTGLLLTGDTLYPGLLFVNDWPQYRASAARLRAFVATRSVSHVLGAHIEMTNTPTVNYAYGTTYQPAEHVLDLAATHLTELEAALTSLGATPPTP
ncbi:MAG: beta-lactamase domain protein, partial [Myxococcales bacterium]|nr:beta-lactamase domain protein [Myxococcales bacterium]